MRIICPNCDAQYEVPDEVIPPEGRDVQCSDCGTTWLHAHPDQAGKAPDDAETEAAASASDPDADAPAEDAEEDAGPLPHGSPPRRELDPEVAAILKQEAERERAARAADTRSEGLEVQPDLGLPEGAEDRARGRASADQGDDAPPPGPSGPGKSTGGDTALSGDSPTTDAPADTAKGSRSALLPDVDEISSTLRSNGDRAATGAGRDSDASGGARKRHGFRRGVLAAVLIFVIGLLIYQFAPQIAETAPQVDPWLSAYVTWVDELRTVLDQRIREVLIWLDDLAASSGG